MYIEFETRGAVFNEVERVLRYCNPDVRVRMFDGDRCIKRGDFSEAMYGRTLKVVGSSMPREMGESEKVVLTCDLTVTQTDTDGFLIVKLTLSRARPRDALACSIPGGVEYNNRYCKLPAVKTAGLVKRWALEWLANDADEAERRFADQRLLDEAGNEIADQTDALTLVGRKLRLEGRLDEQWHKCSLAVTTTPSRGCSDASYFEWRVQLSDVVEFADQQQKDKFERQLRGLIARLWLMLQALMRTFLPACARRRRGQKECADR